MKNIKFVEWQTRSSLAEYLAGATGGSNLLESAETSKRFYSFAVQRSDGELRVGITSVDLGIKPAVIEIRDKCVLIGYDERVAAIELATGLVKFDFRLMAPFYSFMPLDECDHAIIIYEIGLIKISITGETVWSLDTDIIERVERDSDHLLVKIMGQPESITVSAASGKTIER